MCVCYGWIQWLEICLFLSGSAFSTNNGPESTRDSTVGGRHARCKWSYTTVVHLLQEDIDFRPKYVSDKIETIGIVWWWKKLKDTSIIIYINKCVRVPLTRTTSLSHLIFDNYCIRKYIARSAYYYNYYYTFIYITLYSVRISIHFIRLKRSQGKSLPIFKVAKLLCPQILIFRRSLF